MFDINGAEFLVIALIAVILVGPERLPEYVKGLRGAVRRFRTVVRDGQTAIKEEWGDEVDWTTLDPRQYDPRRIVREALFDDEDDSAAPFGAPAAAGPSGAAAPASRRGRRPAPATGDAPSATAAGSAADAHAEVSLVVARAPFDSEAT